MKRGLKILLTADAFVLFAFGLLAPIYAIFVEEIGGDVLDAGITYSIYLFVLAFAIFFISRWENHQRHKEKLLIFSYGLFCVAALGYMFVSNKYHLFIVQGIIGLAQAFNSPVYDAFYTKFLDKGKWAAEWGLYSSMASFIGGLAALIGGAIALYFGFKALFVLMFIFALLGLLASIRIKSLKNRKRSQ